jgi:hypothetical protein
LVVLSIHSPAWGSERVQRFIREHALRHPVAIDRPVTRFLGETAMRYGVRVLPVYAVIDRSGVLRYLGPQLSEVLTWVERLLR